MKICFFLQRRFAYIGYAMAELLNQHYGLNEFCGYVSVREGFDFIKSRTAPRFTNLLLDEEVFARYQAEKIDWDFIKKLEKDYGLPYLWPYIEVDRVVRYNQLIRAYPYNTPAYSHEEMIKIVQVTAKAIIKFLDEEKPDVFIFSVLGTISGLLFYQIAKKRGIKTLHIYSTRIGTKHTVSDNCMGSNYFFDESFNPSINDLFKKLQTNKISIPEHRATAIELLKKFRQKPEPYCPIDLPQFRPVDRRRQFIFLSPKKFFWSVYWWPKAILHYLGDPHRNDFTNINPFIQLWDNFKKKVRVLIGFDDLYDTLDLKENFAFFPLHVDPEVSTLVSAPFYKDQLWLIKQMAYSLPLSFKLYVKEHPSMFGNRPRRFYRELKKIPNVKLINPTIESFTLLKNSKLVFIISGTAGWETIQFEKPVIAFSDVFYTQLPTVKRCVAIEQLPYLVKEQLENFKHDEASLINLLTAICSESVDVDLIQLWDIEGAGQIETKKDQLLPLADLIAKKLNISPLA